MKKPVIMTALSLGLLATPFAGFAKTFEEAYVDSYQGRTDMPVPTRVVSPSVDSGHAGTVVELVFVVDENGRTTDIKARNAVDDRLLSQVVDAVEQWRFKPRRTADGTAVATKVMLPVEVVDSRRSPLFVASN